MVHFIHVSLANGTPENYFPLKYSTLSMFPSQMVRLKIVSPSSGPLYPCFPRKWYTLKLFPLKWSTLSMFPSQMVRLKIVSLSVGPLYPCFPRKWYASNKLFPPQMVHFQMFPSQMVYCFPQMVRLKMVHFIHVSLANGTP